MRPIHLLASFALLRPILAWPGMSSTVNEVTKTAKARGEDPKELIGDLLTLTDAQLTTVGKQIKSILLNSASAESNVIDTSIPANLGSSACSADPCCVYKWISYEMLAKFNGTSGRCTKFARAAVRLGFHDAGAWSKTSSYGGADGSILLSDELSRSDNNGLQEIGELTKMWYDRYKSYGVTMADLIQFGANVATVVCPLGPRIRTYIGRKDNSKAAPTGLLPGVNDSADKLISLFKAKTIDAHGLVTLVGAHTTSQQHFVNTARDGDPQDSTPGVWDVAFYGETTGTAPPRVMKFASDVALSKDSRASTEWKEFAGSGGQSHWNEDYAQEYLRLSLLGVNNINSLKECTKVLPAERKSFNPPDKAVLDLWLQGKYPELSRYVDEGQILTGLVGVVIPA